MAEKKFKTRVVHKHDIESNWEKAVNFIPMQGEIIVYDIDDNYSYERFKIGNGETVVSDLPFADHALKEYVNTEIVALSDDISDVSALVGDTAVATQISDAIAAITPDSIGALDQDDYYGIVQKEGDVVSADSLEGLAIGATTFITATVEGTPDYAAGSVATITPVSVVNLYHGAEYDASAEAALSATLPEPVYGGTLDWVTGVLTVTHAIRDMTTANWKASSNAANRYLLAMSTSSLDACTHYPIGAGIAYDNVILRNSPNQVVVNCSSFATLDDWKAYLSEQSVSGTPLTVVYGLPEAQHYTIQLDPQELLALNGINTVWSDCGDTRVTFNCTPFLGAIRPTAAITNEEIDIICGTDWDIDNVLTDVVTGATYKLYVSEGKLKMMEVDEG